MPPRCRPASVRSTDEQVGGGQAEPGHEGTGRRLGLPRRADHDDHRTPDGRARAEATGRLASARASPSRVASGSFGR